MNSDSDLFFDHTEMQKITETYPTPFHIYDEKGIRQNARSLFNAFRWSKGFNNYFAVKACPNPYIVKILKEEGCGADCSALPELIVAEKVGLPGYKIMFTSNDTPDIEFKKAFDLDAIINLDDITHIPFLERSAGIPELICFRYNPGPLRKTMKGNVMGNPQDAKYGMTREQLFDAYAIMKKKGSTRFGLHTMIVSNELKSDSFVETASMLFDLVSEISDRLRINLEFVNLGGGIGIPYKPEQKAIDIDALGSDIRAVYEEKIEGKGLPPLKIFMENGRMMTGPFGYLITRAIHEKHIYKEYIGVDASMANLMRPGMYGAYHHITVLGKEKAKHDHKYDIIGSLCENNDKFAIDRMLPKIKAGDLIAIHNAGAHGHAMGFNYNGKLRSAELLKKEDGSVALIRRAETNKDYFATMDFPGSQYKNMQ
ncbi:MAG: diaminopimelate decarboxylase [Candidatus Micrarchaeota archaeon]|nr:diaminopimelate decarboxylase [Candidatus Micrarchaeota archaeon]